MVSLRYPLEGIFDSTVPCLTSEHATVQSPCNASLYLASLVSSSTLSTFTPTAILFVYALRMCVDSSFLRCMYNCYQDPPDGDRPHDTLMNAPFFFYTCVPGLFKEIVCDNAVSGRPLPANLRIIAACNPYRLRNQAAVSGGGGVSMAGTRAEGNAAGLASGISDPLRVRHEGDGLFCLCGGGTICQMCWVTPRPADDEVSGT